MTIDNLKYPTMEAAASVLAKIGIDPSTRFDYLDQDFEYTSCRLEELDKYIALYRKEDTSDKEKRLLGCYFTECLDEYLLNNDEPHPKQNEALEIMYADQAIHQIELEYRKGAASDPDHWEIAKYIKLPSFLERISIFRFK
ncbi:MAG: hypothetical protein AAFQ80_22170 [Cyanobacteria bacterium J06621_8]